MILTLSKPVPIRAAGQWVTIPIGARVELVRRVSVASRDPIRATLDRANAGQRIPAYRIVRLCDAWPPAERGKTFVMRADHLAKPTE